MCDKITTIKLPEKMTKIDDWAFEKSNRIHRRIRFDLPETAYGPVQSEKCAHRLHHLGKNIDKIGKIRENDLKFIGYRA